SDGLSDELERSGRDPKVFEQLLSLKNVIYCGQVSLREVPPYIAACDVGLVPYCLSEFTRTSSPIKAFEYLGMGKPVVSTNIPAAIREDLEIFVSAEGSYVDATEAALAKVDGRSQLEARILSVASDTVEARAKQLSNLLVHQNS
ncbi:MAG: glycosyltransferase, partial [Verrucomicrobiota bacterium]